MIFELEPITSEYTAEQDACATGCRELRFRSGITPGAGVELIHALREKMARKRL